MGGVGGHHSMRDYIEGHSIWKVENHCLLETHSSFPGDIPGAVVLSHYLCASCEALDALRG